MDAKILQEITNNFTQELTLSLSGHTTSLAFIKNILPDPPLVQDGETFQVMVIGGTNFRSALITKSAQGLEIHDATSDKTPLLETKSIFFSFLEDHLSPDVNILTLNFGFPLKPVFENGKLDNILSAAVKEHHFEGLVGKLIGKEFENYLLEKNRKILVSEANDTICLLAAGLTEQKPVGLAAGIVGTGMNFAFFLDNTTAVNLEAGAFDKFPRSEEGIEIDNESTQKGANIFEKELSGGFLYKHFNLLAEKQGRSERVEDTEELNMLAEHGNILAQSIFNRSAQLVGAMVAGITNFKKEPMTFVMQGSLFWKAYDYKTTVEETVTSLAPQYPVVYIGIADSDILGAAKIVA